MKLPQLIVPALAGLILASCQQPPVYVPVYVPVEQKTTKKSTPKPKPVETAEGFRAVEKPTTYSP